MTKEEKELVAKCLSVPSGYASVKLGITLHPTQKQVLDAIFSKDKSKVSFRAGNGTGKTSVVITAAILYALDIKNAQIVSTAAVYRQITHQLIPSLKAYSHMYPKWIFLDSAISIGGINKYVGFSTLEQGTFQGYHSKPDQPLLMIVDEAAAVNDEIYKAIDRCQPTWLLVTGSPLDPQGMFYEIETKGDIYKQFYHFKLTQPECSWIKPSEIKLLEEKWGKAHPLILSSVYAEFAKESENSIITFSAIENCINHPPVIEVYDDLYDTRQVFLDVAAGGDLNVIALFHKGKVSIVKKWRNTDTMAAAGEILVELQKLKQSIGLNDNEVIIDADGLGIGIANRLQEMSWKNIHLFHGNASPTNEEYLNAIAEVWIEGCKNIEDCKIVIPNDEDLKGQLISRQMKRHSNGKMKLESKEDMKKRGISSPDVADAVLGCIYKGYSKGLVTFIKPVRNIGMNYDSSYGRGMFAYT